MADHRDANRRRLEAALRESGYDPADSHAAAMIEAVLDRPQNRSHKQWPAWAIEQLAAELALFL